MANTPNYSLYKPSRNDNVAVDTSLATNFDIIDTTLKENATNVSNLATRVTTLETSGVSGGGSGSNGNAKDDPQLVSVYDYGVIGNGTTDDTVKLRLAITDAINKKKTLYVPKATYLVSPDQVRVPGSTDGWCLDIPSNASIHFEPGAVFKLIANAPAWSRIIRMQDVSNIRFTGHLELDGQCLTVTAGNEHMHNLFLFNAKRVYIESVYSHDSYGDNIFVGGDEVDFSQDVQIDYFKGFKAGRKNFVIHYVDQLHVKTAIMDNSTGNSDMGWTGGNSIDLEPDAFEGTKQFYQRFDYISTYGTGNDFTVGVENGEKWIIDIGTFDVRSMNVGNEEVLLSYGLTMHIDKLNMLKAANNDCGLKLMYDARWTVNEIVIDGGGSSGYGIECYMSFDIKPKLSVNRLIIKNGGSGLKSWGADVFIGNFYAENIQYAVVELNSTAEMIAVFDHIHTVNCSGWDILNFNVLDGPLHANVKNVVTFDDRLTGTPQCVLRLENDGATLGTSVGSIHKPSIIPQEVDFGGSNTISFAKVNGIWEGWNTPEGKLTAPIGSVATVINGGAGTTFYVKESGTGNTGWVAKGSGAPTGPKITVSTTQPSSPALNDVWISY